jgi:WD40 repeat protein
LPGDESTLFVALSHDGGLLARLGKSRATVWDTADGRRLGTAELPDHEPSCAAFSPDGAALVVAFDRQGVESSLLVWDVAGRKKRLVAPTSAGLVYTLSINDNGEVRVGGGLASAVYDLATGRELTRIDTSFVSHAAFSHDGRRLATATFNEGEDVSLWDVPTGQQVARLPVGMTIRQGLSFSPDGRLLAASGRLGAKDVLRVWDSRPRPDRIVEKAGKEKAP